PDRSFQVPVQIDLRERAQILVAHGIPPARTMLSVSRLMLPPEITHATFPAPAAPAQAAATDVAAAPSATTWLRSARRRSAAAVCSSDTTSDPASNSRASGHISGRTAFEPMPSTKLLVYGTSVGSPAAREAPSGAAVSTSEAKTRTREASARSAEAIPQERPPPPYG